MEAAANTPICNGFILFCGSSYMHTQISLCFVGITGHSAYRKEPSLNHLAGALFSSPSQIQKTQLRACGHLWICRHINQRFLINASSFLRLVESPVKIQLAVSVVSLRQSSPSSDLRSFLWVSGMLSCVKEERQNNAGCLQTAVEEDHADRNSHGNYENTILSLASSYTFAISTKERLGQEDFEFKAS